VDTKGRQQKSGDWHFNAIGVLRSPSFGVTWPQFQT
jgi:hypothetical protein